MIISKNPKVKEALLKRWKQLGLYSEEGGRGSHKEIVRDAMERAPEMKITGDRLSKYLSGYKWGGKSAGLTEGQLIWLLIRWNIPFSFNLGTPEIVKGNIEYSLPDYNETQALRDLENNKFLYNPSK